MARVTLNGIKRAGIDGWKGRPTWSGKSVRIWSGEHGAYWRPKAEGYTTHRNQSGVWSFEAAYAATEHCGPEKQIVFERD